MNSVDQALGLAGHHVQGQSPPIGDVPGSPALGHDGFPPRLAHDERYALALISSMLDDYQPIDCQLGKQLGRTFTSAFAQKRKP